MDLIQALEQLTLEVRNHSISNKLLPLPNTDSQSYKAYQNKAGIEAITTENERQRQLKEFDSSIDTLFAQISDLEVTKLSTHNIRSTRGEQIMHQDRRLVIELQQSQEDDSSDCSTSQQSSFGTSKSSGSSLSSNSSSRQSVSISNPLVRDLLGRDLCTITDTVKKISQILTLGKEIETIYKSILPYTETDNIMQHDLMKYLNLPYNRSLCEAFIILIKNEPHIRDLPLITSYTDYCDRLMTQVNTNLLKLYPTNTTASSLIGLDNIDYHELRKRENNVFSSSHEMNFNNDDTDDEMSVHEQHEIKAIDKNHHSNQDDCFEDDVDYDDVVDSDNIFCSSNQEQIGTWTENKLYMDQHSNK